MQQEIQIGSAPWGEIPAGGVSKFAAEVVARLVQRDGQPETGMRETLVLRFMATIASTDPACFEELKPELRRARVTPSMLADLYIPEVARRLGQGWEDDVLSFAEVTMGVARLQAILREVGSTWSADRDGRVSGPMLLLVLPQGEQHTLGAMVLAGWLRREGISVSMKIAPSLPELAHYVAERTFDGALVSTACNDRLETCRKLVKTLKESSKGELKVAIGGAILHASEDVMRLTGADMATNDIGQALSMMGVSVARDHQATPS